MALGKQGSSSFWASVCLATNESLMPTEGWLDKSSNFQCPDETHSMVLLVWDTLNAPSKDRSSLPLFDPGNHGG